MKMCVNCNRVNKDDEVVCVGCGENKFITIASSDSEIENGE